MYGHWVTKQLNSIPGPLKKSNLKKRERYLYIFGDSRVVTGLAYIHLVVYRQDLQSCIVF